MGEGGRAGHLWRLSGVILPSRANANITTVPASVTRVATHVVATSQRKLARSSPTCAQRGSSTIGTLAVHVATTPNCTTFIATCIAHDSDSRDASAEASYYGPRQTWTPRALTEST